MLNRATRYPQCKLERCIRLARECSQDYRQTKDRRYLSIKRDAMQDARYWREQIRIYGVN